MMSWLSINLFWRMAWFTAHLSVAMGFETLKWRAEGSFSWESQLQWNSIGGLFPGHIFPIRDEIPRINGLIRRPGTGAPTSGPIE